MLHYEPSKVDWAVQPPILTAQNKKLWNYLKVQNHWDDQITFLFCRLANTVPTDKVNQFWMQCAVLANNGEAERSRIIGRAMEHSHRFDLATKLFGQACRQALRTIATDCLLANAQKQKEDELMVSLTRIDLFHCFIELNDWYAAEMVWREDERKASPQLRGSNLGKLALAAARAGNKKRAISFWKEKLKWDVLNTDKLSEIAKAGLKQELVQIYLEFHKKDPKSEAPNRALAILKALPN